MLLSAAAVSSPGTAVARDESRMLAWQRPQRSAPAPVAPRGLEPRNRAAVPDNGYRPAARAPRPAAPPPVSAHPAPATAVDEEIEAADVVVAPKKPGRETWWGDAWPAWDRVVDALTARTVRKHTFGTLISHRNYQGVATKPFHSLLGFDGGQLKVGLGLRYGILDNLDVGLLRYNGTSELFNTYEIDARYALLTQARFGVDLALRVGLSWFEQYHASDSVGALVQVLIDHLLLNRALIGAGFLFHSNSSGPKKSNTDTNASAAVQAYTDVRLYDGMSFAVELTQPIAGYHLKYPVLTFGPRFITNRHTFSIVMSNSQYTDADGIITGSDRSIGKWVLGFNITREL